MDNTETVIPFPVSRSCRVCGEPLLRFGVRYCSRVCLGFWICGVQWCALQSILAEARWAGAGSQEERVGDYLRNRMWEAVRRLGHSAELLGEVLVEIAEMIDDPMENPLFSELPEEVRAKLKRSYAHPDYCQGGWDWLRGDWEGDPDEYSKWILPLYSDVDADWGNVYLIPLGPEGAPFRGSKMPLPTHQGWAININFRTWFVVEGTVEEAKALLDPLLACPSPEIPCEPPSEGNETGNGETRGLPRPI